MAYIAIVDDEKILVNSLSIAFKDEGHHVCEFYNGIDFLQSLDTNIPEIVLLDLRLPDVSGLEILEKLKKRNIGLKCIMITAHGDINSAIKAMKAGAYDFVNKPFELDEIMMLVDKASNDIRVKDEIAHLRERNFNSSGTCIIGESQSVKEMINSIQKIGIIEDCTVLVRGESGTGKELVAKAIHGVEDNAGPFIEINCSAFSEHLLESELFGHEKGAFTDAKSRKTGLIELADNGTLFLDEIGELSPNLQAKLLRFLEMRKFRRVGGNNEIKVKLKIVAATNRDLEASIRDKSFRKDLFYRLNVVPINVPLLKERGSDVLILAEYFIDMFAVKFSKEKLILSSQVQNIFVSYAWPGNVRELKNLIERLVIMSSSHKVNLENLPIEMSLSPGVLNNNYDIDEETELDLDSYLANIEYELIQDAIIKAKGIKFEAAKLLGISRHSLKRRLQRLENEDH